ncbi:unnamed protein product [Durusdinium trenchii]|uniref:Uncharacterized protein n=1 Tax=Durusdinium trenchii TaxID=1381693 RepID=A0ABP0SGD0_9DINO
MESTALEHADPQRDLETLAAECKDYSGELLRRLALKSSGGFLSTWTKEWCLLTHNFLAFFASRTDLAVKQCLLLVAIQDLKQDGRTLRILLEGREEILRMPEKYGTMDVWADEIRQRIENLRAAGQMITPCMSFAETQAWAQEALAELSAEGENHHQKAEDEMREKQCQAFVLILHMTLLGRLRSVQREAFTDLALHSRIQVLSQAQRNAAACRLWRALKKPCWRQWERTFALWRCQTESQDTSPRTKKIRLALALSKLGTEAGALQFGLLQLSRHRRAEQRKEQEALMDQGGVEAFYKGLESSSSRPRSAAQLLRLALVKCSRARLAATLSRWSHFAAEGLGADVQQLQGQTKSVNAELAEYRCNVEVEGRMKCFVLSLGTAVQRQQMIALRNLQSKGGFLMLSGGI